MTLSKTLGALALAGSLLAGGPSSAADPVDLPTSGVISHVTVLPMTPGGVVLRDQTVVLKAGRIFAIGASGQVPVPKGLATVDGRGKYLMPALADMHVHVEDPARLQRMVGAPAPDSVKGTTADYLLPFVANGVLQVYNLSSSPAALAQRAEVESGRVLGPHMALAVMLDGDPPVNPGLSTVAATPEQGRKLVAAIGEAGYDAVKTYSNLTLETFLAIVDEARKRHLPVVGHIPLREQSRTAEMLQPGFGLVAHAEEYAYQGPEVSEADIPRMVALAKATGTWLLTTLTCNERIVEVTQDPKAIVGRPEMKYVHPWLYAQWLHNNRYYATREQRLARRIKVVDFNAALVRALHAADVPILVGTDALVAGVVPGFGVHDELQVLARAGLPNEAVLAAATRVPAEYLGVRGDRGTVEVGKRADLLLLDANPLEDVANTRRIAAVIVGGRVLPRARLDAMMAELAARYAAMPPPPAPPPGMKGGHLDHED